MQLFAGGCCGLLLGCCVLRALPGLIALPALPPVVLPGEQGGGQGQQGGAEGGSGGRGSGSSQEAGGAGRRAGLAAAG